MSRHPCVVPAGGPRRIRLPRIVALASLTSVLLASVLVVGPPPAPATAVEDGGASSRVTRDGRILTTILFPGRGRGSRPRGDAITWLTLTDAELAFVFQLAAARPELAGTPLLRALEPYLAAGIAPDVDVQVQLRGGVPTSVVRVIPADGGPARALARQMVTVLPALRVRTSPPAGVAVPVGEPVFLSFDPVEFATPVDRSLVAGGVTARVRARATGFQARSGDPTDVGRVMGCAGPGRGFDPASERSPAAQAADPASCTLTYRTVTGVADRRDAWIGDVTVIWRAEWTVDGTTWLPLGDIPRLTLLSREVRPVDVVLESRD